LKVRKNGVLGVLIDIKSSGTLINTGIETAPQKPLFRVLWGAKWGAVSYPEYIAK
jgi:hypothetical protein